MKYLLILIALLIFNSSDARKKYYKWTDADGNIHYSETKPENQSTSEISVSNKNPTKTSSGNNEPMAQSSNNENKSPEEKAVDEYNKALKAKNKKIQDKANCKIAKQNLATINNTIRVSRVDPKTGQRVRLGDAERMQMMKVAQQSIKDLCK